jgi:hypothetical protein
MVRRTGGFGRASSLCFLKLYASILGRYVSVVPFIFDRNGDL